MSGKLDYMDIVTELTQYFTWRDIIGKLLP